VFQRQRYGLAVDADCHVNIVVIALDGALYSHMV
jgi:hypothetical protein